MYTHVNIYILTNYIILRTRSGRRGRRRRRRRGFGPPQSRSHLCMYIYMYIYIYICIYIYIYREREMCICIYIYTLYIYIYTHTYTYLYMSFVCDFILYLYVFSGVCCAARDPLPSICVALELVRMTTGPLRQEPADKPDFDGAFRVTG